MPSTTVARLLERKVGTTVGEKVFLAKARVVCLNMAKKVRIRRLAGAMNTRNTLACVTNICSIKIMHASLNPQSACRELGMNCLMSLVTLSPTRSFTYSGECIRVDILEKVIDSEPYHKM
jgi:hypothetical protein